MQKPDERTVQGDFSGRSFEHQGVVTTFSRRDGRYLVRTDGPDGRLAEFGVAYLFGVTPLEQYLLELPGGRLQALGIAWDSRAKRDGGQRFFHLYPKEHVPSTDVLHWTKLSQNWNTQCAECHSTNLRKGFDLAGRRFETTWSELSVSCEACHGPGSRHVQWALAARARGREPAGDPGLVVRFDERRGRTWTMDPTRGIAKPSNVAVMRSEVESCARCHARRGLLTEEYRPGRPLAQTHRPALLEEGLYYADGQMRDEVYTWGSFLQSRMYAKGVTCSRLPRSRTALRCAPSPTWSAPRATRPSASRPASTTSTATRARAPRAWRATCGPRPTWSWTRATTTRSACRART